MVSCKEYETQFSLHLDGELDDSEKRVVEAHLEKCQSCRKALNKERWFREGLERSTPLYTASDKFRNRITALIDEYASTPVPAPEVGTRQALYPWLEGFKLNFKHCSFVAAFASLLAAVALLGGLQTISPAQAMSFSATAVDVHQRHTLGRLPLELVSDSPNQISSWFDGKVPFRLKLPDYQEISGQNKLYSLKGARLIGFKNDYAAYVSYQMGEHPISLVVTSSSNATPGGGEKIYSKGLVTHFETIAGLKVLTWMHRGLTYALVSDLEERGQQSCLVCHQGEGVKGEGFIGQLSFSDLPVKAF